MRDQTKSLLNYEDTLLSRSYTSGKYETLNLTYIWDNILGERKDGLDAWDFGNSVAI